MRGDELSNEEWAAIEPLLPPEKPWTGRPGKSHRTILNGIFWLARSGSPWRELPERYGPWRTVATRFYRWARGGLFDRLVQRLQGMAEARGEIDWGAQFIDSTIVRAHQVAAGAKGGQEAECLGRSRGGFGTKLHLKCDGHGRPLAFTLSAGQANDQTQLEALLDAGAVKRPGHPGRPRLRPAALVGDKGYASRKARNTVRQRGIRPVIPSKADETAQPGFDRKLYRERNQVERLVNRLKRWRKIATRYEKRALYYAAFVALAITREWLLV